MSLAADSPVSSSSGEDFAAYLDTELDSKSSDSSPRGPEEEQREAAAGAESENDVESKRIKRTKFEELESIQDFVGSTSDKSLEMSLGKVFFLTSDCYSLDDS
uniref:Uncharacterized protein n=1 Tax=Rhizophora mucronata TaxID=61149 RepID=A0A2P2KLG0_RHIMU